MEISLPFKHVKQKRQKYGQRLGKAAYSKRIWRGQIANEATTNENEYRGAFS